MDVQLRGFERRYPGEPQALTSLEAWVLLLALLVRAPPRVVSGTLPLTLLTALETSFTLAIGFSLCVFSVSPGYEPGACSTIFKILIAVIVNNKIKII